ncbi:acyl-CoA dehydrogenase family protein [Sphingobium sp.]|uniref:acyl-CoA dehydrogenase family protein n=1 Tax=Sphingobium sp. TaxID=1912891 RepID=UPI0028BE042B|nr:acyl-CoA dehydrogenase family protein [Sphingobium sp.]
MELARDLSDFRDEVAEFCKTRLPADIRSKVLLNQHLDKTDFVRWMRILQEKGWLIGHWPQEYGGQGWSHLKRWLFENELYRAGSPWLAPFGITYVGPVIYNFGNDAQKRRWLEPTISHDIWWAQGYSERSAGSDLANLQTRAVRDGDHYVVSGHKIWTSMAQWADMMFTLVRTDPDAKPQCGISFLLIDLKSPGVSIRPIKSINLVEDLNEVFLDEVRVPVENLVGEEGGGWTYAKFLLDNERLISAEVGKAQRLMAQLRFFLSEIRQGSVTLAETQAWRQRMGELELKLMSLVSLCNRMFSELEMGNDPGLSASMLKIVSAELLQAISGAHVDALSQGGLSFQAEALVPGDSAPLVSPEGAAGAVGEYLFGRVYSIWGGSSEVQKNILAKAVLGL